MIKIIDLRGMPYTSSKQWKMPAPQSARLDDIPPCGYFTDFQAFKHAVETRPGWVVRYAATCQYTPQLDPYDAKRIAFEMFVRQLRTETNDPVIILIRIRDVRDYSDAYPIGHQVIEAHAAGPRTGSPSGTMTMIANDEVRRW